MRAIIPLATHRYRVRPSPKRSPASTQPLCFARSLSPHNRTSRRNVAVPEQLDPSGSGMACTLEELVGCIIPPLKGLTRVAVRRFRLGADCDSLHLIRWRMGMTALSIRRDRTPVVLRKLAKAES